MEVYYVIGLDDDWKPQHTMRIASREPITQDNISAAFKAAYAKVVIAQEVYGMGVAVESATNDRQAALEALDDCLEKRCSMPPYVNPDTAQLLVIDHEETIRAALTAQDVNAELLEALSFYANVFNHKPLAYMEGNTNIQIDGGNIARKSIARAEQKGGV